MEILLGLERGFLSREGEFALQFNPQWPGQAYVGAGLWNFLLVVSSLALVVWIYRREGRSRSVKIVLGAIRMLLLGFVIALLNRPALTLGQSHVEPSVVAILVDDSVSMRVRDIEMTGEADPLQARLDAAVRLLSEGDRALIRELSRRHNLRIYRFNRDAEPIFSIEGASEGGVETGEATIDASADEALAGLQPTGQSTQVADAVLTVLKDLQGQRLAGVVLLTDGRETPARPPTEKIAMVKDYAVKIFPVPVGSDRAPMNIAIQSVNVEESAFKGDIVNVRVAVRGTGYDEDHPATLRLIDRTTGAPLRGVDRPNADAQVALASPVEVELQFLAEEEGTLDLLVEAVVQPGEIDEEDNSRAVQIAVLDARINVLYVDGYPRWEYRYLKNEMIREKTVVISCLLTSADPSFAQEGDRPIRRFPESMDEIMQYDVVLFGDVDPRQFTDGQLQLVADFVANKGGGFGMIAGPRWSPIGYRNTIVEAILPVGISRVEEETGATITTGFRPVLTRDGAQSSIFRFFPNREQNEKYLKDELQQLFWYSRGVLAKPGVGEVYAEHPNDISPDGRKAPILVVGRYGAGRTLFSAIDDSWRWRFYTGESIFDTYWVQQLRYLARSKKLGQRGMTLTASRPSYELGDQVRLNLRVLDPELLRQLPNQLVVEVMDESGNLVRRENFQRQEGQLELYTMSYTADRVGRFSVQLPPVTGGASLLNVPIEVVVPRLELIQPQVDRALLTRLASETLGQVVPLADARDTLPGLIPSAAKIIPITASQRLWDAPLALALFALLITTEWIVRKMYGMV